MKNHILIYTEGSFKLGLGNIYRSLSLANKIIAKKKCEIQFITTSDESVSDILKKNGFSVVCKPNQDKAFDYILENTPQVLIIDFLGINKDLVREVKHNGSNIVIIGNDNDANLFADVVVNAIIGTNFKNNSHYKNKTLYLEGTRYLALRDEFTTNRYSYKYKSKLHTIALLFGGTDQSNFSYKVLRDLLDDGKDLNYVLVLGSGYKCEDEIEGLIKDRGVTDNVIVLRNVTNVAETLLDVDFLITSPGTTLFEAFCLGLPSVALFQNENQQHVFGSFFMTKKYEDIDNISDYINSIYDGYNSYVKKVKELEVGLGENEIVENIIKFIKL